MPDEGYHALTILVVAGSQECSVFPLIDIKSREAKILAEFGKECSFFATIQTNRAKPT